MKKVLFVIMAVALIGLLAAPAWAGSPQETTAKERVQAFVDMGIGPEAMPEVGLLYFIDLMSNAVSTSGNWVSFLVVGNWSLTTRIEVFTAFIPTGGTPADIKVARFFINPNDIIYLTAFDLGFNEFGNSNWFGNIWSDTNIYFSVGVLLFHTEFGLTWIPGDGPWQI